MVEVNAKWFPLHGDTQAKHGYYFGHTEIDTHIGDILYCCWSWEAQCLVVTCEWSVVEFQSCLAIKFFDGIDNRMPLIHLFLQEICMFFIPCEWWAQVAVHKEAFTLGQWFLPGIYQSQLSWLLLDPGVFVFYCCILPMKAKWYKKVQHSWYNFASHFARVVVLSFFRENMVGDPWVGFRWIVLELKSPV